MDANDMDRIFRRNLNSFLTGTSARTILEDTWGDGWWYNQEKKVLSPRFTGEHLDWFATNDDISEDQKLKYMKIESWDDMEWMLRLRINRAKTRLDVASETTSVKEMIRYLPKLMDKIFKIVNVKYVNLSSDEDMDTYQIPAEEIYDVKSVKDLISYSLSL